MALIKGIRNGLESIFFAEKETDDTGFIYNTGRFVFAGVTLWKDKSRFVIPASLLGISDGLMLVAVVLHHILYYNSTNWMNKIIDYGWISVLLSSTYIITVYKKEVMILSKEIDRWWKYTFLEKETAELKKKSEDWMKNFNFYYLSFGVVFTIFYDLLPVAKFFYKDPGERMDALIFSAWTPVPLNTTWGYLVTFIWEAITMFCGYVLYNQVFVFLMTFSLVISYQMRLVGTALITVEARISKMMADKKYASMEDQCQERNRLLDNELSNIVDHFQHLYRSSWVLSKIFSSLTNVTYHGGMWVMCSVGVRAATEPTPVILVQAFMMINIVILSQYVFSFISEFLIEEVQKLRNLVYDSPWYRLPVKNQKTIHIFQSMLFADRFPTLRTIMGTKTNMENLSKVVNASYCYFSMIITMKPKEKTA